VALLGMTFPSLGSAFQNGFNQALTASQASVEALTRFVEMSRLKLIEAILEYLAVESGNSALFSAGSGTGGSGQGQASGTPLGARWSLLGLLLDGGIPFTEAVFQVFHHLTAPTLTSSGVENGGIRAGGHGKG
jgi:hypothetical protein